MEWFFQKWVWGEFPWPSSGLASAFIAESLDLTPGWGTKIPQAVQCG